MDIIEIYKYLINSKIAHDMDKESWKLIFDILFYKYLQKETSFDSIMDNKYQDIKKDVLDSINMLAENTDNILQVYKDLASRLEEENRDLRLKIAQYEEDKKKSIPKGVAKAVTFNSIINFIETCYSVQEAKVYEYMLLKLMTLGDCDRSDFSRLEEAMAKVRERESRNVINNFNAPFTNSGTLSGDIKYNQDKKDDQ